MKLKREKILELMNNYTFCNYNRFVRDLKVDPAHLHRFLRFGVCGSKKIVLAMIKFCKENNLDVYEYIDM